MRPKFLNFLLLCLCFYSTQAQKVKLTTYASNLGYPIDIRHCNDDRLFVADRAGRIRIVNPDKTVRSTPFLDIRNKVSSTASEEGFLGFCFSPGYKTNGKFYVSYTTTINNKSHSIIEEYKVNNSDSNLADPATALTIITVEQPYRNHNGGQIVFGRDGYLYFALGDGGSSGDPLNNAQNKGRLLGKILRIDVASSTSSQRYVIPSSNPFANAGANIRKEIWATGMRNPWRMSFDRLTHDLWIADVGEGRREEINFQEHNSNGGENYGWKVMEGNQCYSPSSGCDTAGFIKPLLDYDHQTGRAIIGGYVYRSVQSRALWGLYIYADFRGRWIDGIRQDSGILSGQILRLMDRVSGAPTSFGEDRYGELYLCVPGDQRIYKVEDASTNPFPKAHFLVAQFGTNFQLSAVEGRGISYQWLYNNAAVNGANTPMFTTTGNGEYKLVVTNSAGNKDTSTAFVLSAALPVTLTDFMARNVSTNVIGISWNTQTEHNNKEFAVERKLRTESSFHAIKFVPSLAINGNSSSTIHYATYDTVLAAGPIQYRLKQTDFDGKFNYSPVVTVNAESSNLQIFVSPNPARGWVRINTNRDDLYEYQLNDFAGKEVLRNVFRGYQHQFSVSSLGAGLYYLRVQSGRSRDARVLRVYIGSK